MSNGEFTIASYLTFTSEFTVSHLDRLLPPVPNTFNKFAKLTYR